MRAGDDSAAWWPGTDEQLHSNLAVMLQELGLPSYDALYRWSVDEPEQFWGYMLDRLRIRFQRAPRQLLAAAEDPVRARWLPDALLNIAESCFLAPPDRPALLHDSEDGQQTQWSYGDLERMSRRVAHGLQRLGVGTGSPVGLVMAMTPEAVAAWLGVVLTGAVVVSLPDSLAASEMAARLALVPCALVLTQDVVLRANQRHALYSKLCAAAAPRCVVVRRDSPAAAVALRAGDVAWEDFLPMEGAPTACALPASAALNILFSSGTTAAPKAIPWTQATPLKCAMDGHCHHDIRPGDVVAWPTSPGWMMGPWLICATLINGATLALFEGTPSGRAFTTFVQQRRVTLLGLVPSLVKAWRSSGCVDGLDWQAIRRFSSTGECSNAADMRWLMDCAGGRPVIEYCGGTEIGGAYLTQTLLQPAYPSLFSTPALGLRCEIRDTDGQPAASGELFLAGTSIGLSTDLLGRNHHAEYYAGTPNGSDGQPLRRHGDEVERLPNGYYRALGRADDTMNLGGIKVAAAEIERVLLLEPGLLDCAAVALAPAGGGPSQLVIFAVMDAAAMASPTLQQRLQQRLSTSLNPLFRIAELRLVAALPRTASNKILRRQLRSELQQSAEAVPSSPHPDR